ncbi:LysR family transcriptional regulator [uncultured Sphingomonas sp.]|uniref:LysR family transcriptional regulator n=1 Tax=uncultured Sphingomonas sp. TaxID=158754 RepID=UPI002604ABAB|nr:LysR family transcriptional regulator [uncultured Sphingomonas sp.]
MSQNDPARTTQLLSLRHIEVFHAIYANGSASAAAVVLNVSQPSISKTLRHAEDRLGFALFHRVKGRLSPTEKAHILFSEIDEIHEKLISLQRSARNLGVRGETLKVSALPGFGLDFLPRAVACFRAVEPHARFELGTLHSADILRRLQSRDCDIMIGCEAPMHPQLACQEIGSGQIVVLHRPGALGSAGAVMDRERLRRHKLIGMSAQSGPLARIFHQEVARRGIDLDGDLTVDTMYIGAVLARLGAGLAVSDDLSAPALLGEGLISTPFEPPIDYRIFAVHLADAPLSRIAVRFVKMLRTMLAAPESVV